MGKIKGIIVDGANLHASCMHLGFMVDYSKVAGVFPGETHRQVYCTALHPANEHSTLRPMVDWLDHHEWDVISKDTKRYLSADGSSRVKGNMDVEITLSAVSMAAKITDLILFSGDGDFCALVKYMKDRGVRVTVVSTRMTRPSMVADTLRRAADQFVELRNIAQDIKKDDTVAPERRRAFLEGDAVSVRKTVWGKNNG